MYIRTLVNRRLSIQPFNRRFHRRGGHASLETREQRPRININYHTPRPAALLFIGAASITKARDKRGGNRRGVSRDDALCVRVMLIGAFEISLFIARVFINASN